MSSSDTCIDIAADRVILDGASKTIKGPGTSTSNFGILVESTANKVILENITVEDLSQGVHVDGPNFSAVGLTTTGNKRGTVINGAFAFLIDQTSQGDNLAGIPANALATDFVMVAGAATGAAGAGILLNGVNGAFIEDATAEGNGKFGIWLKSASNNAIDGFVAESNGIVGVYLGCNTEGPNGTTCAPEPFSGGNSLSGSVYGAKNSVVSNTGSPLNQKYGVAVDGGDLHNHITATTGTGNTLEDAVDGNGCGSNRWFGNSFTNSSPAKGAGFFCIN